MNSAPEDAINAIGAIVKNCGKTAIGAANLLKNDAPPRYVWIPDTDDYTPETSVEFGSFELGVMGAFWQTFTVEVWGADYSTTWRMRAALLTAVRQQMPRSFKIGAAEWINEALDSKGWKCLQTLSLLIPLVEQDLPDSPKGEITDRGTTVARPTTVSRVTTTFEDE